MLKGTSLDTYNIKSETVNNAIIQLGDIDDTGKGKHFTSRFIQAGLVKIEGHGIVLLKKETLDMSLQSMVGAPVIIKHQDVTDENADELRCGVISKAYFNDFDGWYYAEGIIWDTKAQELINNKDWSVSCSYDFLSYNDEGGVENNIKYDKEFTSLNFTHLALVNNPRYERANIVFNSKDEEKGKWVTIKGSHIFIKDGETLDDAMKRNGWGKKSSKISKEIDDYDKKWQNEPAKWGKEPDAETQYRKQKWEEAVEKYENIKRENLDWSVERQETKDALAEERKAYKELEQARKNSGMLSKYETLDEQEVKDKQIRDFYEQEYQKGLKEIETGKDYAQINYDVTVQEMKLALDHLKRYDSDWDKYDVYENIKEYSDLSDDWNKEQIGRIAREKATQDTLKKWIAEGKDRRNEYYKIYEPSKYKPDIKDKQETNFEKYAFNKENFQKAIKQSDIKSIEKSIKDLRTRFDWAFGTDKKQQVIKDLDELYDTLSEASTNEISEDEFENLVSQISEVDKYISDIMTKDYTKEDKSTKAKYLGVKKSKTNNSKEIEMTLMEEIKKLISKVENNKENEEMIENEKTDKRKLIDEVAGIMKSAGCDDEDIRTAIGKMEKIGYDASEDSKADNKKVKNEDAEEDKKVENEDEEDKEKAKDIKEDVKEDVENKCKNSKSSFDKINEIYNSVKQVSEEKTFVSRQEKLDNAVEYFK